MRASIERHLTYANVMASIAVFAALGGVSYAAVKLPANSVGGAQLKADAVTGAKVKNASLTGSDVKDRSLTSKDFIGSVQGGQGPQGLQGPAGPQGVKGDAGPSGAFGPVTTRSVVGGATADNAQASATAVCHADEIAVGGGGFFSGGPAGDTTIQASRPFRGIRDANGDVTSTTDPVGTNTADMWGVTATNHSGGSRNLVAYALCVARPG